MEGVVPTHVGQWLSNLIKVHLGPDQNLPSSFDIESFPDGLNFLNDPKELNLFITFHSATKEWALSRSIKPSKEDLDQNRIIVLYKIKPERIVATNTEIVQVTMLPSSPLDALYYAFNALSPAAETGNNDVILKASWARLNEAFQTMGPLSNIKGSSLNGPFLHEEIAYVEKKSRGIKTSSSSLQLSQIQEMILKYGSQDDKSEPLELVEHIHDILDELWTSEENQSCLDESRMSIVIDKIGTALSQQTIQYAISHSNPDPAKAALALKQCIATLDKWIELSSLLTEKNWPYHSSRKWTGPAAENKFTKRTVSLFAELNSLRSCVEAAKSLLSEEEQKEILMKDVVNSLYHLSIFEESKLTQVKNDFENWMKATYPILVERVEGILSNCRQQPGQLIKELTLYLELLKRPEIADRLVSYKKIIVSEFTSMAKIFADERHVASNPAQSGVVSKILTPLTASLVFLRQRVNKVEMALDTLQMLAITDIDLRANLISVLEQLRSHEKIMFEDWISATETSLSEMPFESTSSSSSFLNLDFVSGKLNVNYDDRIITILRESRQLLSLGFPVPARLQKLAERAQRYFRVGVVLKQVAHFYNTIDQQMLPSQQSMLLARALELENLLKQFQSQGSDDENLLMSRIQKIQSSTELLTMENRRLRKYHDSLIDIVNKLIGTDLVNNQSRWKELMANIRRIVQAPQDSGINQGDTLSWRNHWDYQIYKALEHQYQVGLHQLNESLTEIKVDLVFKQQKLQFRPPFEEIRAKYYREMKKFINIPMAFKPLGESGIFSKMIHENSASLLSVYSKAEQLFHNLSKVADGFKDWVVLGTIDMDEFLESCLVDISDWELNFKMVKQKGKELENIPNVLKVDCITVSLAPIKSSIEYQLQKLFDGLVYSLRVSIGTHIKEIENFIERGTEILIKKPQTLADIGQANQHHEVLSREQSAIKAQFDAVDPKNKLLKSVGGAAVDMSLIVAKWNKFELMLESHDMMIKEQIDVLRGAIEGRVQSFLGDVAKFSAHWNQFKPNPAEVKGKESAMKALNFVKNKAFEFDELDKTRSQLVADAQHFGLGSIDFSMMDSLKSDLKKTETEWSNFEGYVSELEALRAQDWVSFRTKVNEVESLVSKWSEIVRLKSMSSIGAFISKDLDDIRAMCPILKIIRGDTWISEHWAEFFWLSGLGKTIHLEDLTVGHLLDTKAVILEKMNEIKDLNNRANGEVSLREALQELDVWGATATLSMTGYQDAQGRSIEIIKEWKETLTQVGDSLSLVSSLKDSPFFKNFEDRAKVWEQKLSTLDHLLRDLNLIQRRWVYLEPVFNRGALPAEQPRFLRIDDEFRTIIHAISQDKRIVSILSIQNIGSTLPTLLDQLERCQKALAEFLEQKRDRFPRFYFIGDEDLLEILGQAKNPVVIQSHLKKLFAGVHQVEFDETFTAIIGMKSLHGERISLKRPVQVTDNVEDWLQEFTIEMKYTMKQLLIECLNISDPLKFPLQIVSLSDYLHFTSNVEDAIKKGGDFGKIEVDLKSQLGKYTTFNVSHIENVQERALLQLKIKSLILDVIHFIDVIDQLKRANPKSTSDWCWRKQLRFYMKEKDCIIQMNDAQFNYTYEYQGIPPKLVHTPLTDKCYLTLTQAMATGFGGNPFGPAGTGKTESVKALGILFGRQVLVFNCDEGIDYKSMGRIFVGLIKCGAWGCFDEFNRLDESVLSAVSQQIQIIQAALKKSETKVTLLERTVDLDPNSGIFVTLNPAGKGYGGRQKLPDNLKQLFRSVAMTHPDNDLIAEVILFSEGFEHAKILGKKVVSAYTLCKQLLSRQQHYDWGLRPLKAVLSLAGHLLHSEIQHLNVATKLGREKEEEIVVRALSLSTLSKLTFTDSERFRLLLKDLFPSTDIKDVIETTLLHAIHESLKERQLAPIETQIRKVVELHEACRQRMGVVIVGPTGSGKSTLLQILKGALLVMGKQIVTHYMNPKSVSKKHLLGHMDLDTREWTDGILTFAARQAVKESLDVHTWIVCDGDIDPEWIEALNSVLDDNRLLTMPNGERIQFGPNVNFIFESHDLQYASPATVSRMGMIYLSDENTSAECFVNSWLNAGDGSSKEVRKWMTDYGYRAIQFMQENCKQIIDVPISSIARSILCQMENVSSKVHFLNALCRGISANIDRQDRMRFEREVFKWGNETIPENGCPTDYYVDQHGSWQSYQLQEPESIEYSASMTIDQLPVIETADVQRAARTLMPWLKRGEPILFVGPQGSGKSTILRHCFEQMRSTKVTTIHCNGQTNSSHMIQRLLQTCTMSSSQRGRILRPRDADRLVVYIKDINLAKPDKYQTVELVQFLHQVLTYRGFYDTNLEWITVESVSFICSMDPALAAGRTVLSTRFSSLMRIYGISHTDREQLLAIYQSILRPVLNYIAPGHPFWAAPKTNAKLANSILYLYEQLRQSFTPDLHTHYVFSPRDVSKLIFSFTRYHLDENDKGAILDILTYEASRIFEDRLVTEDHKLRFQGILQSSFKADWSYEASKSLANFMFVPDCELDSNQITMQKAMRDDVEAVMRKNLHAIEQEQRLDFPVAVIPENISLLNKIERSLSQKGGSALLAVRNGIPTRGLLHLAGMSLRFNIMTPKLCKNYSFKMFCADVKQAIQKTGVEGQPVILVIETHHVLESSFLEIINSILSGPDLSCLFTREEMEAAASTLKDAHAEAGFRGTLTEYLASRVKDNLHIALCFDVESDQFPLWCESNPAFFARCDLIWATDWSSKSLILYANQFSSDILSGLPNREAVLQDLVQMHRDSGQNVKFFMDFIASCKRVYSTKLMSLNQKQTYLQNGLSKLKEASDFVDNLAKDASKRQLALSEKQREADIALKRITESMVEASDQKREMETLTSTLREEEINLVKRKQKIEQELSEVEPILKAAQSAVGEIKSESLSEVRSLRAPPPAIRDVLEGVLRLMGNLDMSWNNMKIFLGKRTVKEEIMNFDARKIPRATRDAVEKLLNEKKDSFEEATIRRVSVAAYPLAMWVKANLTYSKVVETVAPLEEDLAKLVRSLDSSRQRVQQLKEALDTVEHKVSQLKQEFADKTREAEVLKSELEHALNIIQRSQGLLSKLSDEGHRWTKQDQQLKEISKSLVKMSLLSGAFITYLGLQFEDNRAYNIQRWIKSLECSEFSFAQFMTTESEQLAWKAQGLPSDTLSVENAVLITTTHLTPLIQDPAGQATIWLKTTLATKKPEVVYQGQEGLSRSLELAIRFGKTLIIQDVTQIDPIWMPVLRRDIQLQGPRSFIEIGDKVVDFNEDFQLFLVTKSPIFPVQAEYKGYLNVVNFSITRAGLTSQLLGITLQQERPQLETQKLELLQKEEDLKMQLAALEEKLLKELANSQGNLLENVTLIESLNETKGKGIIIEESLKESRLVQESLELERKQYTPIAEIGSALFFVILDLQSISNMYSFSLASFLILFKRVLRLKEPGGSLTRIDFLVDELKKATYQSISLSLFKSDRAFFAIQLIHALYGELFEKGEWEVFIGSTLSSGQQCGETQSQRTVPVWIPDDLKSRFEALLLASPYLERKLDLGDKEKWLGWIQSSNVDEPPPVTNLSPFQRVLLVQALRPHLLMPAIMHFSSSILALETLSTNAINWKELVENSSSNTTPILFIATPGADPSQELRDFGTTYIGKDKYHEISMGQGQCEIALELIRKAALAGEWVCLQNVHLVVSWLPLLEKTIQIVECNEKFRLWMITEAHDKFPRSLLQRCTKITLEPPPGVKNNLLRIYSTWTSESIARGSTLRAQCLFSLACFHAIIQERRNYLPQGWTKFYEFSSADLRSAAELLTTMIHDNTPPQWSILHGLLRDAIYGARIDVAQDLQLLETYLFQHFTNDIFHIDSKGSSPTKKICGILSIPRTTDHSAFVNLIQSLPEADVMPHYGLPANIDISLQKEQCDRLFGQLRQMKQSVGCIIFDRDKWSELLSPHLHFWKKLHPNNQLLDLVVSTEKTSDPILSFLQMELKHGSSLIKRVHIDLANVTSVLRGSKVLDQPTMNVCSSLMKLEVPESWLHLWEGPSSPQEYMTTLVSKTADIAQMTSKAQTNALLKSPIRLSSLFNAKIFLNAFRQHTSRTVNIALDSLRLQCVWGTSSASSSTSPIVQIEGIRIQGALFDGNRLLECGRNDPLLTLMPLCQISWIPEQKYPSLQSSGDILKLPLYEELNRESLIVNLDVPCGGSPIRWIQAGTAFFI